MSGVDLSALRLDQRAAAIPPRPWGPRLVGAIALLLAATVALTFLWPMLRPVRAVPMVAVRSATAEGATTTAFAEAAGWIEPDPFPIIVRPLVAGRVESIEVLEGAPVQAGSTVIARLASAELLAEKERAVAVLAERDRELRVAEVALELARAQLGQRAQLRMAVAEARLGVSDREGRLAVSRGVLESAIADARGAEAARQAQEQLNATGGTHAVALARAQAALDAAEAVTEASRQAVAALERELADARARLTLAEELLDNPVDLQGAVLTGEAAVEQARAESGVAAVSLQIAERELQWTEVLAPFDGAVMRLLVDPGAWVGPEGEGILAIYDPQRLRARIDVPLGSVGGIREGQAVELHSEVLGDLLVRGVVQRVQRESDLLKNTLQVKVQVLDPPSLLRPETLCRARFLGGEQTGPAASNVAFLVPKAAVREGVVFVFDPARRCARAVPVQVVHEDGDGIVVRGELSVAQRVILAPVKDGESVREEQP